MVERRIDECWIWNNMEGSGCGLIKCTTPEFTWKGWEIPRENSDRIVDLQTDILTKDL
jgi:hypothetical protein